MCAFLMIQYNSYAVGDLVMISADVALVKRLQAGHGEWSAGMTSVSTWLTITLESHVSS